MEVFVRFFCASCFVSVFFFFVFFFDLFFFFFFSSRRRHTRYWRDWSSYVCSSDLAGGGLGGVGGAHEITPLLNGVVGLEHHRDARPLRHESAEALEERTLAVDRVEARGVGR